jgi:hypothetical protein
MEVGMAIVAAGERKGARAALFEVVREVKASSPAPTITSSKAAGMMRIHSRPVPNPRRFKLTSASEYSNQVERNEERHTHSATLLRACEAVSESPNSSEKISNYLNIWRIAVSSDRTLACPLKPREMQNCVPKDAASPTKLIA